MHALSRRVHTHSEISHVARYAAEASGARGIPPRAIGVDRALCSALVPLLLGTISNWPRATIARGSASERYAYARTSAYTRGQKRSGTRCNISESETLDNIQDLTLHAIISISGERTASAKWRLND